MRIARTAYLGVLTAMLGMAQIAAAQDADDYRGGWRTDTGEPQTYQFSIRGSEVRGVFCTHCSDATTLAFIDGELGPDGIDFVITHVNPDGGTAWQDHAIARYDDGDLVITGTSGAPNGGEFQRRVIKDPRGPDALPVPVSVLPAGNGPVGAIGGRGGPAPPPQAAPGGAGPPGGTAGPGPGQAALGAGRGRGGGGAPGGGGGGRGGYVPPGPWRQLTPDDVVGVWLGFGVGINKQYFMIRKVADGLRGMVCGRCDNPYTMAALDDFVIDGDTMTFSILHEDWGPGPLPFINEATVRVAMNEMRLTTQQDNMPRPAQPPGPNAGTSLLGPISIEATRGND